MVETRKSMGWGCTKPNKIKEIHLNTICVPGSGGNRGVQQGGRPVTSSRQVGKRGGPGGGTSGGPLSRSTGGNLAGGSSGGSKGGGAGGGSSSGSKGGRGGSGGRSRGGSKGNGSGGGTRENGGSRGSLRGNGSTGGSLLENSIFDAKKNVGRGNNDGARSESRISSGGFKGSQNVERQNSKRNSIKELKSGSIKNNMKNKKSSIRRILNNNNRDSEDNSSSNDRITPYKDYVNTAGNSFKVFKLINDDLYRLPNVLKQPKLPKISFLLLEPILKI